MMFSTDYRPGLFALSDLRRQNERVSETDVTSPQPSASDERDKSSSQKMSKLLGGLTSSYKKVSHSSVVNGVWQWGASLRHAPPPRTIRQGQQQQVPTASAASSDVSPEQVSEDYLPLQADSSRSALGNTAELNSNVTRLYRDALPSIVGEHLYTDLHLMVEVETYQNQLNLKPSNTACDKEAYQSLSTQDTSPEGIWYDVVHGGVLSEYYEGHLDHAAFNDGDVINAAADAAAAAADDDDDADFSSDYDDSDCTLSSDEYSSAEDVLESECLPQQLASILKQPSYRTSTPSLDHSCNETPHSCDILSDSDSTILNLSSNQSEQSMPSMDWDPLPGLEPLQNLADLDPECFYSPDKEAITPVPDSCVASDELTPLEDVQLEKTIADQQHELKELSDKLTSHDTAAKKAIIALQSELKQRVDAATRQFEDCRKEKDIMVMKFALAEQKNIAMAEKVGKMESHLREVAREREAMMNKFRQIKSEKAKVSEMYDAKSNEVHAAKKEIERQKDLVETQEVKVRWAQNKLKVEVEAHKDSKSRVDEIQRKLKEAKEETEMIRRDCQAIVKTYQESEEIKSNSLDQRLKETEGQLLMQQQERSDQRDLVEVTKRELEQLKHQHRELVTEFAKSKDRVQCLDAERICREQSVEKSEATIHALKAEIRDKDEKLIKFRDVNKNFFKVQEDLTKFSQNCSELEQANKDLVAEMEGCSKREGEHLEFSRKISDKNAQLQSENTHLNSKVTRLSNELEKSFMDNDSLKSRLDVLEKQYREEYEKREEVTQSITEQLELKSKAAEELSVQLEDERDSVRTLKRKHQANIKDLTRQLHQVKKRLEGIESPKGDSASAGSMGSRTSSTNSIDAVGATRASSQEPQAGSQVDDCPPIVEYVEVDKQMLMEKIVKLQKSHARKNEKLEFMEDHINQLLVEVQKKSRIIQSYVLREETGTLASEASDRNKNEARREEVKAALAKRGGIMASVFSQHAQDGHMTLDLSLQITRKLQAVLEDTLLKNITLKENLDTLGQEIAKLSQQNRQLEISLRNL